MPCLIRFLEIRSPRMHPHDFCFPFRNSLAGIINLLPHAHCIFHRDFFPFDPEYEIAVKYPDFWPVISLAL